MYRSSSEKVDITSTLKVKHVINYPQIKVHSRQPTTTAIKISIFFLFLSVYLPIPRSYYTLLRYPWFKQKKTLSCLGIAPLHDFCVIPTLPFAYEENYPRNTQINLFNCDEDELQEHLVARDFLHSLQWTWTNLFSSHNRFRYKQDFIPKTSMQIGD